MSESDLTGLSEEDLHDIEHAADIAVRHVNIMSAVASRFISLERRARTERHRRMEKK